jgi:hypothetical protein
VADADRLRFALTHLQPGDWEAFEGLASAYLSSDFAELRLIAGAGDEGRDAVFSLPAQQHVVVQFAIVEDWKTKINLTLDRLAEAGHACTVLIYATSREIGPRAEAVKKDLLQNRGVFLDVRDRAYFVDQVHGSIAKTEAARALADRVVDPMLPGQDVVRNSSIENPELRAGLLYLELQRHDQSESRNITGLTYDTFVLGSLRETDPDTRLTRSQITAAVHALLPGRSKPTVKSAVNRSLEGLQRAQRIVVTKSDDSFALHYRERLRRDAAALRLWQDREAVRAHLDQLVRAAAKDLEIEYPDDGSDAFLDALQQIFERTLEDQGNRFAEAVRTRTGGDLRSDVRATATSVVTSNAKQLRALRVPHDPLVELATETATNALIAGGAVRLYLRELADAYTLLAFMQEAPDVQKAVSHFFSRGQLLLDTSVLLPCLAESILSEDEQSYTNLLRGAREAGMKLYVTGGVLNEIASHLRLSLNCHRMKPSEWRGDPPLVYADWCTLGLGGSFEEFVDRFCGSGGEDDIRLFLDQALGIELVDVERVAELIEAELRFAVTEIWRPRKTTRLAGSEQERDILLRHDIEMYFAVLGWRKEERPDVFGHEAWWVTSDGAALRMRRLAKEEGVEVPSDPCMSPSFLANILSIGPSRVRLARSMRQQLPVSLGLHRQGLGVPGLSQLADAVRAEHANDPEWLLRRRIRDRVNEIKADRDEIGLLTEIASSD